MEKYQRTEREPLYLKHLGFERKILLRFLDENRRVFEVGHSDYAAGAPASEGLYPATVTQQCPKLHHLCADLCRVRKMNSSVHFLR